MGFDSFLSSPSYNGPTELRLIGKSKGFAEKLSKLGDTIAEMNSAGITEGFTPGCLACINSILQRQDGSTVKEHKMFSVFQSLPLAL